MRVSHSSPSWGLGCSRSLIFCRIHRPTLSPGRIPPDRPPSSDYALFAFKSKQIIHDKGTPVAGSMGRSDLCQARNTKYATGETSTKASDAERYGRGLLLLELSSSTCRVPPERDVHGQFVDCPFVCQAVVAGVRQKG